jgi:hypothetical protein|tara:strand:- start:3988 stop:4617 length:630 start_codon:yes stop_codon:yes gene_type:complete
MALTQGHAIICCDRNRRGGLKRIWLMEKGLITGGIGAVTIHTTGEYIAFPSVNWYEFEFDRGTAGFNANATRENGSTLVNIELEFYIPKITEEINARLRELTESCGIHALCETYADDCDTDDPETYFFIIGYDKVFEDKAYLEFASGEQTTGMGLQDANGTLVKLAGIQAEYPREALVLINNTNVAAPAANLIDFYQASTGSVLAWTSA